MAVLSKQSVYNRRIRAALLVALGGKCVSCGIVDARVLQVDHVAGDGYEDRRLMKQRGTAMYKTQLQRVLDGYTGYQLLCANCNWIKRHERGEVKRVAKHQKPEA